jgi:pentatricopeptide repeat protein
MRSKGLLKGPFISDAYNGLINAYAKMGMAAKAMDAFRELLRHAERFGGRINNSVCASLKFAIMDRPEFDAEADELIKLAKKWNLRAETQGPGHRDGRDGFNMRAPKLPRARQTVFGVAARSPPHVYRNRDSVEEERRQTL